MCKSQGRYFRSYLGRLLLLGFGTVYTLEVGCNCSCLVACANRFDGFHGLLIDWLAAVCSFAGIRRKFWRICTATTSCQTIHFLFCSFEHGRVQLGVYSRRRKKIFDALAWCRGQFGLGLAFSIASGLLVGLIGGVTDCASLWIDKSCDVLCLLAYSDVSRRNRPIFRAASAIGSVWLHLITK